MKYHRVRASILLLAGLSTIIGAAALMARSGSESERYTQTVGRMDALARAETDLDRDLLQLVAGVLPHYDPLVLHARRLREQLRAIQEEADRDGSPQAVALWEDYRKLIEGKENEADHVKGAVAFINNEESYLPLAVHNYAAHGTPDMVMALGGALVQAMAPHVPDDLAGRMEARLAPVRPVVQAQPQSEVANIVSHLRTLAQQRQHLQGTVDAYFAIPSETALVVARRFYLDAYAHRHSVALWMVRGMLVVSSALFGAMAWLMVLLGRADYRAGLVRERMRKLSTAVDQSPIAIVITDRSASIEYVNPYFCRLTGYALDEVLGANPRILKSGQTPPEVYEEMWRTLSAGMTWQGELVNRKKNGGLFIEHTVISPVTDDAGETTHYIAMKEDITRLRENEALLADAATDIERMLFAASHDLQEPVRLVSTYSQLFQRQAGPNLPDEARQSLNFVLQATTQMRQLVNGLARFARSSRTANPFVPVNCGTLVTHVVDGLRQTLVQDTATVVVGDLPTVQGDATLLCILFENLISNALKFRRPNLAPRVTISASPDAGGWRIDVADNGIGIPREQQAGIMRPFSRLYPRGTYPGAGLGLATCLRILKLHGGRLSLDSLPGRGSTFHVWLPAGQAEAPAPETSPAEPA